MFVVIGGLGLLGLLLLPVMVAARQSDRKTHVRNALKQLGVYYALYEGQFKAYPSNTPAFEDWLQKCGMDAKELLTCSRCGNRLSLLWEVAPSGSYEPQGCVKYTWPDTGPTDGAPPDLPIAWHRCPLANVGDDLNVLYFQGRVDVFAIGSPAEEAILNIGRPTPSPK